MRFGNDLKPMDRDKHKRWRRSSYSQTSRWSIHWKESIWCTLSWWWCSWSILIISWNALSCNVGPNCLGTSDMVHLSHGVIHTGMTLYNIAMVMCWAWGGFSSLIERSYYRITIPINRMLSATFGTYSCDVLLIRDPSPHDYRLANWERNIVQNLGCFKHQLIT
jgi:hypothetical protein